MDGGCSNGGPKRDCQPCHGVLGVPATMALKQRALRFKIGETQRGRRENMNGQTIFLDRWGHMWDHGHVASAGGNRRKE